jgi:hypothetical protein
MEPSHPTGRLSATILGCLGLAALALGIYSATQAMSFLSALDVRDPPLAAAETAPSGTSRRLTERVVLIIVDGLRVDASRTMQSLAGLRAAGIDAEAESHYPSLSRPNYVSILAGVPPQWSGVRSNEYDQPVPLDSAPKRAKAAGLGVSFISQVASGPRVMFGAHVDHAPIAPRAPDLEAASLASLYGTDELVAVLIGAVDDAGHAHGAASEAYAAAVAWADAMLDRLLRRIDLQRQTVIVVADHGHIDAGGHGGLEPEVMTVPLVMAGAGIRPGAPLVRAQIIDVAPTVCALLGLPMPRHALGLALVEALNLEIAERDEIRRADVGRIAAITARMAVVRAAAEGEAWATRITRGGLALFVLAVLIAMTVWAARRRIVLIDLRVLLVAVPAFPLTFYAMVLSFEQQLTPSMIPAAGTLAPQLFAYGGLAALVHTAVGWIMVAHRSRPSDRVAAAAGLVLAGTVVTLVPAAIMWVVTGPPFTARLPGPDALLLPPATYVAVACYCMGSFVFVGVEDVAFVRRRRRDAREAPQQRAAPAPAP